VDPLSPNTLITQTLANEHEVTSAPPTGSMLRPFKSLMKQGPLGKELADKIAALEATVEQLRATEDSKPNCSPAGTELRIDWADACSLGRTQGNVPGTCEWTVKKNS
jgi:hypothetical protein